MAAPDLTTARTGPAVDAAPRQEAAATGRRWWHSERPLALVMALPALLPFVAFSVLPILYVVYISFTDYDGLTSPTWAGLDNYRLLLQDASWWDSVRNTFVLAIGKMVIELPLALLFAVILNRPVRGRGAFTAIYFLPHVMSLAVMGVVFYFLFRPQSGVINGLLQGVGLVSSDVDWLGDGTTAMATLVTVGVWAGFGINAVLLLVGMQTIPPEIYESAAIDGANGWQQFRRLTLPLLAPVMRIVVMLTIVFSLRTFDLVKTLTDGGPAGETNVMFTYLFDYFFSLTRAPQYGYGSALGVGASLIIAAVSVGYLYLSRRQGDTGDTGGRR